MACIRTDLMPSASAVSLVPRPKDWTRLPVLSLDLSRKFWSGENFGPGDYYFQKILVRAWNNGPSSNTLV